MYRQKNMIHVHDNVYAPACEASERRPLLSSVASFSEVWGGGGEGARGVHFFFFFFFVYIMKSKQ